MTKTETTTYCDICGDPIGTLTDSHGNEAFATSNGFVLGSGKHARFRFDDDEEFADICNACNRRIQAAVNHLKAN